MHLHSLHLPLFDIRLTSAHKDVLLLKGNENEVQQVPFEGHVKFSIPEDIHVKRVNLSLVGEFNVEYFEKSEGAITNQHIDRLCVLAVEWDNLLTNPIGRVVFGNYGDKFCSYHKLESFRKQATSGSTTPEERPGFSRAVSSSTLDSSLQSKILKIPRTGNGVDGTPFENATSSGHSFFLPKGNYNLPFTAFLPTDVPQTVEGLTSGSVLFKLTCNIERGRFEKAFHTSKVIRILRTLHPRNMNMVSSIDIDNTWPGKVQYNVSLPKKGVAIGSTIPINIMIVPIAKGLTLKGISACIVQHYNLEHSEGPSPVWEQIVAKQSLYVPKQENLSLDQWSFKTHFKVEDHLKLISPTCSLKHGIIVVKHRLRLSVQLQNEGGHISELRANLPIHVYISAKSGHVYGRHFYVDPQHGTFVLDKTKDDIIFKKYEDMPARDENEESDEEDEDAEDAAPPLYQQHVFDKKYDINSPQTPLQQSLQSSPVGTPAASTTNLAGLHSYFDMDQATQLSIDESLHGHPKSLRSESAISLSSSSVSLDVRKLCKVPTYEQALEDDEETESLEPAPKYSDDDLEVSATPLSFSADRRPPLRKGLTTGSTSIFGRLNTHSRSHSHLGLHKLAHVASPLILSRNTSEDHLPEQ